MFHRTHQAAAALAIALLAGATVNAHAEGPINALYVTGGGWHDYPTQEGIITEGLADRVNIEWTVENEAGDNSGHWPARFEEDNWMADFDVVVYNFCITDVPGAAEVEEVVQQHVDNEVPAVFLHCAIHSFRADTTRWFEFAGARSHRHEGHRPFLVEVLESDHPIMQGFPEDGWQTPRGELYEIEEMYDNAVPLAHAYGEDTDRYHEVIWTNEYEGVNVFVTTIGHHNETMEDPVYLDFVSRGLLWSIGALQDDGTAAEGYAACTGVETVEIDGYQWYSLFDGESLDGWRPADENPDVFWVEDGKIVIDGPRSHLFYEGPVANANFKNFHFRSEVYTYPQANSGIFFHTEWQASGWPSVGYEAQVNATHGDRIKTGSVYAVANLYDDAPHEDNEWWLYEIIVEDDHITLKVDGETVMEYTEDPDDIQGQRRLSSGTFSLQAHDPDSRMYFREIYVRPIDDNFEGEAPDPGYEIDSNLVNVLSPDNAITPLPSDNSPDNEGVELAIDGDAGTKFLHFDGHNEPSGFEVTIDSPAVVTAMRLTSANDAPERDPASYRIEGRDDNGEWVEIASGELDTFRGRHAQQAVGFENDRAFDTYRILFPTVANPGAANSMQIAQVELFADPGQ